MQDVAKRVFDVEDARDINYKVKFSVQLVNFVDELASYPWPNTFSTSGHKVLDASSPSKGRRF